MKKMKTNSKFTGLVSITFLVDFSLLAESMGQAKEVIQNLRTNLAIHAPHWEKAIEEIEKIKENVKKEDSKSIKQCSLRRAQLSFKTDLVYPPTIEIYELRESQDLSLEHDSTNDSTK